MTSINLTVSDIVDLQDLKCMANDASFQPSFPMPLTKEIGLSGYIDSERLIQDLASQHRLKQGRFQLDGYRDAYIELEIGVDEVGRGPLYGSVVVAAVILPKAYSGEIEHTPLTETVLNQLTDSKKLTKLKRERLFPVLKEQALAYIIVEVPATVIDQINILQATLTGMRLACEQIMIEVNKLLTPSMQQQLKFKLLIDGNKVPELDWNLLGLNGLGKHEAKICSEAWVKGDARHTAIAAASVLAKVTRDTQVIKDGLENPGYGLEKHKGYPTKTHIEAIEKLGVLAEHRRSFKPVQKVLDIQQNNE